jgi:hypothetical protein
MPIVAVVQLNKEMIRRLEDEERRMQPHEFDASGVCKHCGASRNACPRRELYPPFKFDDNTPFKDLPV